jgi:penicillin-binding protein 1A
MSRAARQRRRKRSRSLGTRLLLTGGGVVLAALVIGVIAAVGYAVHIADRTPNPCHLTPIVQGGSSALFASNDERLGFIHSAELRTPISWGQIPQNLRDATIAIEDQRFYKNNGVDLTGIFRAAVKDVIHGRALQGASTITMQLVRNLYMHSDTHSFQQKIEEAKMALDYAKCRSKHEILTEYLNSVPYGTVGGQTAIGVQAAARTFFNKPASQLNLEQAALLAGLPQAPSEYNPFSDPRAARQRRNEVLGKMRELHYISGEEAAAAERSPLQTQAGNFYTQRREDFFFEYVREQLEHRYGRKTVEQGGLRVYTTLDLNMQRLARRAIAEVLNQPEDPASAVVTINPANGDIEAMAESESYEKSQYNLAADGHRQPGSTFKAIDLADALSKGIDPNTTYYNSHTLEPGWLPGYPTYLVKTFGGEQNGTINLVAATLKSDNTVYAQLAADLGEETITQMAYAMGVKTHLSSYPAEALGGLTLGVTPLEMAIVYATLADGGYRNEPIAITKVVFPDGHVDASWGQPHRVKVLGEGLTGEETRILHLNVLGGTAARSQINCPTAAKTGTTSELYDAWLDGYNSEYSTVVWMGYPQRDIAMTDVHGEPQQGGYLPAEIWHAYMAAVTEGHPCAPLHESNVGLTFKPFYGKFASTGLAAAEASQEQTTGAGRHAKKRPPASTGETPGHEPRGRPAPSEAPTPPPQEAPKGPAAGPTVEKTGGAAP